MFQNNARVGLPKIITDNVRYELLRPIAQGGMGSVYEAVQYGASGFRKRVAIKIIREEYASMPLFRKNFMGEAQLVADLVHANIVQIYHLAHYRNRYLMVMEYVNGKNLEQFNLQHCALGARVPCKIAAFIMSRVTRALLHAHRQKDIKGRPLGIVHRDVSPKNIMVSFGGEVKLTDFGIAKAFNLMYEKEGDVIAGRSDYLSPEQARMEITDARADIFSCGVVLLELILGNNIFQGEDAAESRDKICNLPLGDLRQLRPDIEQPLIQILQRALSKNRNDRYPTALDMLLELEAYLQHQTYGPTLEKIGEYMRALYINGEAYDDDINDNASSIQSHHQLQR